MNDRRRSNHITCRYRSHNQCTHQGSGRYNHAKKSKIPQLPVTGIQISNAVGKKICKVSKQIFCECKIGNVYIQTNFIQVKNLNEKGIIGADIFKKYSAQIKFSEQTVQFRVDNISHTIPFASREQRLINFRENLLNVEVNENAEDN